jgi:hypothetical protein
MNRHHEQMKDMPTNGCHQVVEVPPRSTQAHTQLVEPFIRPVRGAVRLNGFFFDPEPLARELEGLTGWTERTFDGDYSAGWSDLGLLQRGPDGAVEHPELERCPLIRALGESFPAPVIALLLARLEPGGWIKEHRDLSGGAPMGVIRFHIPITTHDDVGFYVSGERVRMDPGTLWYLDTSYRHRVVNESMQSRVHAIIDLELNEALRAMLPSRDWHDAAHQVYFAGFCVAQGLKLAVTNPRRLAERVRNAYRLRFSRESVVNRVDSP